jgi:DNA gyrase/topoisomerase IV subunit B
MVQPTSCFVIFSIQDGSHIKGLLINFIHHNWPDLLKLPFLEEFITPIVKATKGNQVVFYGNANVKFVTNSRATRITIFYVSNKFRT